MSTSSIGNTSSTASSGTPVTSPVVSVAGDSSADSAGGSVIDVSELVSELVTAQYASQVSNIENQTNAVTSEISALGTFQGALSTFQSALSSLDSPSSFNALTAQSSNSSAFTASADSTAVGGTYSVGVTQLAQAQQLVSKTAFSGGSSATVGTGTLAISLGGQSFNVAIADTDDTLAGIAASINSASGNPGVTATVLQGNDGAYLVLSSQLTGASNTIAVSSSGGNGGLSQLDYSSTASGNYTQETAAQDAVVNVAGVTYDSASNTISDAITGVTLNLLATTGSSGNATLTVSNDTATVASNIENFVSAYNTLMQQLSSLGSYDSTSSTAGPMQGNPLLSEIQNDIQNAVFGVVDTGSSTYNSLASIGITAQSDGTLSVDDTTLQNALSSNFNAVSQLFSSTGGIASQLNTQLTADLASTGPVTSYSNTLVQQSDALNQQSTQITNEETALTASMTQQYAALNTLLSSLQTTSAYLSEAFADLPQVDTGNSNSSG
ncbi:MAG TPA: flagellar filament capping protein FliD [Steroidobacteraceae bacterium]|nr:flagellar filament capping protein FliD [Steroidobacteraceae bacterium]